MANRRYITSDERQALYDRLLTEGFVIPVETWAKANPEVDQNDERHIKGINASLAGLTIMIDILNEYDFVPRKRAHKADMNEDLGSTYKHNGEEKP